ncbi:hypothetical protein MCHI_001091 [Candidatus Magnetoovum chiemensis]|nr:hypothetical protein MCHI_001091 [Candidatus Magnetoovum chiemensis]
MAERNQIDTILEEQRFSSSWIFNAETTVESGHLWSPRYIIGGSFQKMGEYYRIDGRMRDVETGEIVRAESITGKDIMSLPDKLGDIFINALDREVIWKDSNMNGLQVELKTVEELPMAIYHVLPQLNVEIVEITLKNNTENKLTLIVENRIQGFTDTSKKTIEIDAHKENIIIPPDPVLLDGKLNELLTNKESAFDIKIKTQNGETVFEETREVTLLSRDTWIFENNFLSERIGYRSIAAWITPQSNPVGQIFTAAVKLSPIGMVGYQASSSLYSGNRKEMDKKEITAVQMKAIYEAIKNTGIKYADQSLLFPVKDRQRVVLPQDAIKNRTANCIDGAVLFSSVMLRAGINPIIIIVPGHAFVGWETWKGSNEYVALETTKVGISNFDDALAAGKEQAVNANIDEDLKSLEFRPSNFGILYLGYASILNIRQLKQTIGDMPI